MAVFNETLRVRLQELLDSHGRALMQEPRRLEALLRDLSDGQSGSDLHLLMQGLKAGIPAQILDDLERGLPMNGILPRLVQRLEEAHIAAKAAQWCVNSWCTALGYEVPILAESNPKRKTPVDARYPIHPDPLPSVCRWQDPLLGMAFVWVPAGTFLLGDLFEEGGDDEQPVHEVTLDGFWLGQYPVTQGQWQQLMENNPAHFKKGADYPVEQVSWEDVQQFISKLNAAGPERYRLPSEAEWEYACRSAGREQRYAGSDTADEVAWYADNSRESTHPVGQKAPNALGLHDMSGNVWEWCEDWYDDMAYAKAGARCNNPLRRNEASGDHVLRGGSWSDHSKYLRASYRDWGRGDYRGYDYGFRLVRL
ncbi:MAG: formylglycine-generating enzyme family protein [Magnetococcales bacterium]|nr:formylglycine-generating enzyme family protein [Magnetococcales bacterium]MBF0116038.1 formylglycine-generating enzyme family protein [Magnetococcales bacterium]